MGKVHINTEKPLSQKTIEFLVQEQILSRKMLSLLVYKPITITQKTYVYLNCLKIDRVVQIYHNLYEADTCLKRADFLVAQVSTLDRFYCRSLETLTKSIFTAFDNLSQIPLTINQYLQLRYLLQMQQRKMHDLLHTSLTLCIK